MLQSDANGKLLPSHLPLVPRLLLTVLWVKEGIHVRVELGHVGSGPSLEEVFIFLCLDRLEVSKCRERKRPAGVSEHCSVRRFAAHHLGGTNKYNSLNR